MVSPQFVPNADQLGLDLGIRHIEPTKRIRRLLPCQLPAAHRAPQQHVKPRQGDL